MAESSPVPSNHTFVVRFWYEWSDVSPRWRGRAEHVPSGEGTTFLELQKMLDFIQGFGVMVEAERHRDERKGDNHSTTGA